MIKINLASLKQSAVAAPQSGVGAGVNLDGLRGLPIQKIAIAALACLVGNYFVEEYKAQELAKAQALLDQANAENARLNAEMAKSVGYEQVRKALEEDERMIRAKIDTIQRLMDERTNPPKILMTISQSIPKEVWLNEFSLDSKQMVLKGSSLGFNQISDFMRALGETVYFQDVTLKETEQSKDDKGSEIKTFEVTARRR